MITRSIACPFVDWPLAKATAEQWTECAPSWAEERMTITVDAPRLLPVDAACVIENIVEACERSVRMHSFVRRGP